MRNRRSYTEKIIRLGLTKDETWRIKRTNELLSDVLKDVQGFVNPVSDLEAPLLVAALRYTSEMIVEELYEESAKAADSYYGLIKEIFQCERKDIAAINVEVMGKGDIYGI